MRELASILQTIKTLDPIPGKDRIVLATFESVDFKVIVGKTDFKVGDRCVYVESDSILPQRPEFEFLRARCWSPKWNGFRIKNMKMGGIYSQGIVFPLSILTDRYPRHVLTEGIDVTEEIGVIKFDPESFEEAKLLEKNKSKHGPIVRYFLRFKFIKNIFYPKHVRGNWPEWASHTDETRVQILPYVYDLLQGVEVYVTEKVDGQSLTAGYVRGKFTLCSRNICLPKPKGISGKYATEKSLYWQTVKKYWLEEKLAKASKDLGIDLYIQGEQVGPTIQDNKYHFDELRFMVYNIKDVTNDRYFNMQEILDFCCNYSLEMVYIINIKKFDWKSIDELLAYSKGDSIYCREEGRLPVIPREGIVIRPTTPMLPESKMANMLSFKVINPDFDLMFNKKEE